MMTKLLEFTSKTKVKIKLPKLKEGEWPHKAYFCHVHYKCTQWIKISPREGRGENKDVSWVLLANPSGNTPCVPGGRALPL